HGGVFPHGLGGAVAGASALVLKFIGFGMTPTMVQEIKFPAKKMVVVILSALIIPAVVYMIITVAIGGLAPHQLIAGLRVPEPELVPQLYMLAILGYFAMAAVPLYAFTTLWALLPLSTRVVY